MGFMDWLMKGVGFENQEVYDDSAVRQRKREEKEKLKNERHKQRLEEKQRRAQEKADRAAKKYSLKQAKDLQEKTMQSSESYVNNPNQYNLSNGSGYQGSPSSSYDSGYSNTYGVGSNVGGYGSKNVVFVYPVTFAEVNGVIGHLKQGESVMLNINAMNDVDAQRMLDCVCGAVIALSGSFQRVENNIFLLTPEGFNIKVQQDKNN